MKLTSIYPCENLKKFKASFKDHMVNVIDLFASAECG